MFRFIWRNWWRHKERFILILLGAFIISGGLSYMFGLSVTNKGTIMQDLQKRWRAPYDILVRPKGTKSITESENMLDPNYLSQIPGGITLDQYHQIQKINDVAVAAPIAMIGYVDESVTYKDLHIKTPGIYRMVRSTEKKNGVLTIKDKSHFYFSVGMWSPQTISDSKQTGIINFSGKLGTVKYVLLAGIDPAEEAKLVGLDHAVLGKGDSRYLRKDDSGSKVKSDFGPFTTYNIPVLISNRSFIHKKVTTQLQRLDLPFKTEHQVKQTLQTIKKKNGKQYLNKVSATNVATYTMNADKANRLLLSYLSGIDPKTGKKKLGQFSKVRDTAFMFNKPSPINYTKVQNPFPKHWSFSYGITPYTGEGPLKYGYRSPNPTSTNPAAVPHVTTNWVGFYDPKKLDLPKDPLTELPMQTYRPPTAHLVLDAEGNPVNPPKKVTATGDPLGFLARPPMMLTTLKAAALFSDHPISAIRIKVAGVDQINKASQKKLEKIAHEIEQKTGLMANITLGSSPEPAIIHVPKVGQIPELGWIQQPWVHLGAAITIFTQTHLGFSGVILAVMLVAIAYVFATNLVSLLARRKQFAVLLAVGWRPGKLVKMVFLESMLIGGLVAVLAWLVEAWFFYHHADLLSPLRLILVGFCGLFIYFLGAIGPAMLVRRITPYEAIRTGEIRVTSRRIVRSRGPLSMAWNALTGKWSRNLLSVIAIAVPTMLLTLFLFITFQLKGTLYTTWLGQYVALQVGTAHYIAMIIALAIAVLTTAEIMWQNVTERKPELALLKALGWRSGSVGRLILYEGLFVGILAGIVGLLLSLVIIYAMYGQFPFYQLGFILLTGLIPLIVGVLASIWPTWKTVRITPARGIRGPQD